MSRQPIKQNTDHKPQEEVCDRVSLLVTILDDYAITQTITWQQVGNVGELNQGVHYFSIQTNNLTMTFSTKMCHMNSVIYILTLNEIISDPEVVHFWKRKSESIVTQ